MTQGFNPYDKCLTCGRRVGSHSINEIESCIQRRLSKSNSAKSSSSIGYDEDDDIRYDEDDNDVYYEEIKWIRNNDDDDDDAGYEDDDDDDG